MRINNNLMALNTHRQYSVNNSNASKSVEKLSSGLRINRAGDDAAGLAISEKMRAQIRGLNMASKNSQDAISLVQTAEGALTQTHSILQRMRELSVQSSSDTNENTTDRAALDMEYQQLLNEIDDIAGHTAFNGKKLLNGTVGSTTTTTASGLSSGITVSADATAASGTTSLSITNFQAESAAAPLTTSVSCYSANFTSVIIGGPPTTTGAEDGDYYLKATNQGGGQILFELTDGTNVVATASNPFSFLSGGLMSMYFGSDYGSLQMISSVDSTDPLITSELDGTSDSGVWFTVSGPTAATALSFEIGNATFTAGNTSGEVVAGVTMDLSSVFAGITDQASAETAIFGAGNDSGSVTVSGGNGLIIQTGANAGDTQTIQIDDMTTTGINVNGTDIKTRDSASQAITAVSDAINTVSTQRSKLGAIQNRLEHKINNLNTTSENLLAAESRIRDVDMAQEMTDYTKNNILVQAATAMLAQANQAPQSVLQLLQ